MHTPSPLLQPPAACELRFQSLFDVGPSYAFPCDADGHVDIDSLSSKARQNYLYARALIGRELAYPLVQKLVLDLTRN